MHPSDTRITGSCTVCDVITALEFMCDSSDFLHGRPSMRRALRRLLRYTPLRQACQVVRLQYEMVESTSSIATMHQVSWEKSKSNWNVCRPKNEYGYKGDAYDRHGLHKTHRSVWYTNCGRVRIGIQAIRACSSQASCLGHASNCETPSRYDNHR